MGALQGLGPLRALVAKVAKGSGSRRGWVARVAKVARVARVARVAKGLWELEGLGQGPLLGPRLSNFYMAADLDTLD